MGALLCACSDSVKDINEDGICILSAMINGKQIILGMVCDGVGGLPDGEWASSYCVAQMTQWFCVSLPKLASTVDCLFRIRRDIRKRWEKMNENLYQKGCGSTCSIWLVINRRYQIFHVGDSRIYRLRHRLKRLTKDHRISGGNVLWQCIGCGKRLKIQHIRGRVHHGDLFLLGTDGMFGHLEDDYISQEFDTSFLLGKEEFDKCARHVLRYIRNQGEMDDATLGVIRL